MLGIIKLHLTGLKYSCCLYDELIQFLMGPQGLLLVYSTRLMKIHFGKKSSAVFPDGPVRNTATVVCKKHQLAPLANQLVRDAK